MILSVACVSRWRRPVCDILEPQSMTQFGKGEVIEILVDAEDPDGNDLEIQFLVNGSGVGSTTVYPYRFNWDTDGYAEGTYMITAKAVDNNGWIKSDSTAIILSVSSPKVKTNDVLTINLTSATISGSILADGGQSITETGFYWSSLANPEVTGEKIGIIAVGGEFSTAITGLSTNTPYYYKAYAKNGIGESIGEEKAFTTLGNELGFFVDIRDGNEYSTVRIGNQTWMAENLAFLPKIDRPDEGSKITERYYVYEY